MRVLNPLLTFFIPTVLGDAMPIGNFRSSATEEDCIRLGGE